MGDTLTPAQRRKCMAAISDRNTAPERKVRSVLHRLGFRFSLHRTDLPGKPDIVMPVRKVVVLVHGCFWHMHTCKRGRSTPVTRAAFWDSKRKETRRRDRRTSSALQRLDWKVIVIWECQTQNLAELENRLTTILNL